MLAVMCIRMPLLVGKRVFFALLPGGDHKKPIPEWRAEEFQGELNWLRIGITV
jgi:hypothetical protein